MQTKEISPRGSMLLTSIPAGLCVMTAVKKSEPRFIMSHDGHHFSSVWDIVRTENWPWYSSQWSERGIKRTTLATYLLRKYLGLFIVGLPPRRVVYATRTWSEWAESKPAEIPAGSTYRERPSGRFLVTRREPTPFFYIKRFGYAFGMNNVELKNGVRVDIDFTVHIEGINPKRALVDFDDWFALMKGLIEGRCRDFIGQFEFEDLLSEDRDGSRDRATQHRRDENRALFSDYVCGLRMKPHELTTGDEEILAAVIGDDAVHVNQKGSRPGDVIGVNIVGAVIESLSLSDNEPYKEVIAERLRLENENRNRIAQAEAENAIKEKETRRTEEIAKQTLISATAEANAMRQITAASAERIREVTMPLLEKEGGAHVAVAMANGDAIAKTAEAVKGNNALQQVVFPQLTAPASVVSLK